jgi:hypothetical protein
MLNVGVLNVVMLSVVFLSIVEPFANAAPLGRLLTSPTNITQGWKGWGQTQQLYLVHS